MNEPSAYNTKNVLETNEYKNKIEYDINEPISLEAPSKYRLNSRPVIFKQNNVYIEPEQVL